MCGPHTWSRCLGEEKNTLPLLGVKLLSFGCPASSPITVIRDVPAVDRSVTEQPTPTVSQTAQCSSTRTLLATLRVGMLISRCVTKGASAENPADCYVPHFWDAAGGDGIVWQMLLCYQDTCAVWLCAPLSTKRSTSKARSFAAERPQFATWPGRSK